LLTACSLAFAQDAQDNPQPPMPQQQSPAPTGGWRRVGDPPPDRPAYSSTPNYSAYPDFSQRSNADPSYSQRPNSDRNQTGGPPNDQPNYAPPSQLTIKPGTFVMIRINQPLSSDRNQAGDAFSATLARPIVVDGVVVAQRGQTIGGRVVEAEKAGRVHGVSRLGVQLTDLTLVDGQQVPIQSQLVNRNGGTSVGRDAAVIGTTTAVGAAAGAAADWGRGAAIGAGAGAVVGVIGVLLTRGEPTVIYPESVLTFRIEQPVTVSTERAPHAFRYVDPNEYDRPYDAMGPPQGPVSGCAGYGCAPPPYYGPAYYPYYPYYWGPGFAFGYGRGFYGRGYYGGGFYGGGFYGRGFSGRGYYGHGYSRGGRR
jgi:hypothetical protein